MAEPRLRSWIIRSKLGPAWSNIAPIRRAKLDQLSSEPLPTLTLVSAGAGFGKTTFLSSLFEIRLRAGDACAWVTLDELDRPMEAVTAYIILALVKAGVDMEHLEHLAVDGFPSCPVDRCWMEFPHYLAAAEREICLFLDDYHRASTPELNAAVRTLITRLPGNCRLILGSRVYPDLGLARLFSLGHLSIIGQETLKFDRDETRLLFDGLGLADDAMAVIDTAMDGWPVALQLTRLWLKRTGADMISEVRSLSSAVGDVATYLSEEVLNSLDREEQMLLMRTSVVERICGQLADAICGTTNGAALLEDLQRRNLLMLAGESDSGWFKYHHLFRAFLLDRLRLYHGDLIVAAHRSAATWLLDHGFYSEAMEQAQRAGVHNYAADLFEERGGWRIAWRDGVPALRVMTPLAIDPCHHPRIAFAAVYLLMKEGKVTEARRHFEAICGQIDGGGRHEHDVDLSIERTILDYFLRFYEDCDPSPEDIIATIARFRAEPLADPSNIAVLTNLLSMAYAKNGSFSRAIEVGEDALRVIAIHDRPYAEMYLSTFMAVAYTATGRVASALKYLFQLEKRVVNTLGIRSNLYTTSHIFISYVYYLMDDLEAAEEGLEQALHRALLAEAYVEVLLAGYEAMMGIAAAGGDLPGALELADEARQFADTRGLTRLSIAVELLRMKLLISRGRTSEASRIAAENALEKLAATPAGDANPGRWNWFGARLGLARLRIAEQRHDEAITLIESTSEIAIECGTDLRLSEVELLLATAYLSKGETSAAGTILDRLLPRAIGAGLRRLFVEESAENRGLLSAFLISNLSIAPQVRSEVLALLKDRGAVVATRSRPAFETLPLTDREVEVLGLLGDGLSNKEICRRMNIGEATVKFHRKNLYRKFDVSTRSRLIEEARTKGLINIYQTAPKVIQIER
jgi:ATP/maltotriose-dependent transcriptional regulator MalT